MRNAAEVSLYLKPRLRQMTFVAGPASSSSPPWEKSQRTDASICFSSILPLSPVLCANDQLPFWISWFLWTGTLPLVRDGAIQGVSDPTGSPRRGPAGGERSSTFSRTPGLLMVTRTQFGETGEKEKTLIRT